MSHNWQELHKQAYRAQMQGEVAEAIHCYEQVVSFNPGYPYALAQLGQLRMMQSGFREGRELYEARFAMQGEHDGPDWRAFPATRWQGESLHEKSLYLWAEQGVGDAVMFAGFLPHVLKQSPSRVVLGIFPKMISLFARSFPSLTIEPLHDAARHAGQGKDRDRHRNGRWLTPSG